MKNFLQAGVTLALLAPYAVSSGGGFQVGAIFAVATADALEAADVEGVTTGVFSLTKTTAQAWVVGDKIYWNNATKKCDTDGTVGMLIGTATAIAANPSTVGEVRLSGVPPSTAEGPQGAPGAITDNSGGVNATDIIAVLVDAGGTAAGAPTTASTAAAIKCLSTHINSIRAALIAHGTLSA